MHCVVTSANNFSGQSVVNSRISPVQLGASVRKFNPNRPFICPILTTEDFFLTYDRPSFYFHVSITYGILRSLGVHIGVANFLGTVRTTPSKDLPESVNQLTGEQYLETLKPLALP